MLRVYNTLTRTKEPFEPVNAGAVGIYLCGPTVYKPSHIGHMVGPVIFDAVKRYLAYSGYKVTLIVNITDVDDKLIAESNSRGIPMSQLAKEMTADYMSNLAALGVDAIDHFPRCTETIDEIIKFTETLVAKGFAYEAQGDVYFEVGKCPEYGKLSHRGIEATQGDGGGMVERKRAGADFALWKSAKPGEPSWPSPWGNGRPGWHIECSAMSRKLLGVSFDIHGGGLDLMFPHHENEIAQSECCHGRPMAKYWMHNGLMQASSEVGKLGGRNTRPAEGDLAAQEAGKISKSKGSAPFRDMLQQFSGETIRFFVLSTQYRRPIDYSEERLREVETGMDTFYRLFKRYDRITGESYYNLAAPATRKAGDCPDFCGDCPQLPSPFERGAGGEGRSERPCPSENGTVPLNVPLNALLAAVAELRNKFLEAMDDDFNTGGGIGTLFDLVRAINKYADDEKLEEPSGRTPERLDAFRRAVTVLRELTGTLGLFRKPQEQKAPGGDDLTGKLMALLIDLRAEARKRKDFATADRIRNTLGEIGVALEDRPGGTEWSRK
jgi:cysteinyl-tRNA synthetase